MTARCDLVIGDNGRGFDVKRGARSDSHRGLTNLRCAGRCMRRDDDA